MNFHILYRNITRSKLKWVVCLVAALFFCAKDIKAQVGCPVNLDFENGNLSGWIDSVGFYLGGSIQALVPAANGASTHQIISANSIDPRSNTKFDYYGGFPMLCPGGSNYSVKLGFDTLGAIARTMSYKINIPALASVYSITYQYAVVFEDPGHAASVQPKFTARLIDQNGQPVSCASFTYVATSGLPGFHVSNAANPINPGTVVYYKDWTPVTFDLSGRQGQTVTLEFTAEDCGQGGHFGYAYVDVNSGCGSPVNVSYCAGASSITVKGPDGYQNYNWFTYTGGAFINPVLGTTQTLVISPAPAPGSQLAIDLIPYTGFGCRDTIYSTLAPVAQPTVALSGSGTICPGSSTNLNFTLTGTGPWNINYTDGITVGTQSLVIPSSPYTLAVSPSQTVTYTITNITDALCANSTPNASAIVTVTPLTTSFNITGGGNYCTGGNGVSVKLSGSQAGYKYQLLLNGSNTGNPLNGNGGQLNFGNQVGAGTYTVFASNAGNGCSANMSGTAVISIDALPTAYAVTGGGNYCAGGVGVPIIISNSDTGFNYQLVLGNANTGVPLAGTGASLAFPNQKPAGTYTIKASNAANSTCITTMTGNAVVSISALPTLFSMSGGGSYCAGGTGVPVNLKNSQVGFNYQLMTAGNAVGNPLAGTGGLIGFGNQLVAGTYTVQGSNNNNATCSLPMTGSVLVKIDTLPNITITGNTSVCFGQSVSLHASGINTYSWNTTPAFNTATITYTPTISNVVTVTGKGNNGCANSASAAITVNALPSVNISASGPLQFCQGDQLQLNSVVAAGSGTVASYQWFVDTTVIPGATDTSFTVTQTGKYYLASTNSNGCISQSSSLAVNVIPLPTGFIATPLSNQICDRTYVVLTASGGTTGYQWFLDGVAINGATKSTYNAYQPGIYSVQLQNLICSSITTNTIPITILTAPVVDFLYNAYCSNTPIPFTNISTTTNSGVVTWLWNFGDGITSTNTNEIHTYPLGGTYKVTLTANPVSCPNLVTSSVKTLTVEPKLDGIRYDAQDAVKLKPLQLQARNIGATYAWVPQFGLSSPSIVAPVYNYNLEEQYLITITSAAGCVTVDTQLVRIFSKADIFVAKAFTPNKDGKNDLLYPYTAGITQLHYFRIYNRWGQLMFETKELNKGWDGTLNGKPQPVETYTWIAEGITDDGKILQRAGSTLLLR